jgi:hypothetical protein
MFFQPKLIHRAVAVALTSTFGVASLAQTTTMPASTSLLS